MSRPVLHAPIILAHGLLGFGSIRVGPWTLASYFRGIPEFLRRLGARVHVPRVHPTAGIARRARKLAERIETLCPDEPVHIVGHSMGGLDARALLHLPGWEDRVLSLTTIATPHLGSTLAETARDRLGPLYQLLRAFDWDHQGFLDLLPDRAQRLHEELTAPAEIPCFQVSAETSAEDVCWPLRATWAALSESEGANDGLVSTRSASAFGRPLSVCRADHLRQMNWCTGKPSRFVWPQVRALYREILSNLVEIEAASNRLIPA